MGKVEYYTLKPSLKQYFGRKVNKSLKFDEETEDKKVHQVLDNLVLTTTVKDEREVKIIINGKEEVIKTKETSTLEQILPSGIVLIWDQKQGYIIPPYEMATLDEIQDDLIAMKNVYEGDTNDIKGNEEKSIITN